MNQNTRNIVFLPSVKPDNGTGHLRRCLEICDTLNEIAWTLGKNIRASVLINQIGDRLRALDKIVDLYRRVPVVEDMESTQWDTIIVDQRRSDNELVMDLQKRCVLIGLDETGELRDTCDYLIDTQLSGPSLSEPNESVLAFRGPKQRRKTAPDTIKKILITFGGEDPAGLTPRTCRTIAAKCRSTGESITAVRGPSACLWNLPAGVKIMSAPSQLRELLHQYDLIITSYGLTAYEALAAKTAVILVNPTRYHEKLARSAGFATAKIGTLGRFFGPGAPLRVRQLINRLDSVRTELGIPEEGAGFDGLAKTADILCNLVSNVPTRCPVCHSSNAIAIARNPEKSFFRCGVCRMVFLKHFREEKKTYGPSYFFDEYKRQYGKTYLDDFESIRKISGPRLNRMRKYSGPSASLLDVGCAYGPFLAEARERGYRCFGLDLAQGAVEYVTRELQIQAVCRDFLNFDPKNDLHEGSFDILTMWYVIEHFENIDAALQMAAKIITDGGLLCLSTPNIRGISGIANLKAFLEKSPNDHATVWSPRLAKSVLKRYGFLVKSVRVTGHHPERFPGLRGLAGRILMPLLMPLSKVFRLGDTFEAYAVKKEDLV
ncbi:MAG: hypothetical protein CMN78_01890 [Spirochaetales bacterium]|nr:hypothetical protein [Spirochaetales bacterium]